jgi:gamma-glutamylaminecyclotransferase
MEPVFVYGTLKSGEPNFEWMTEWKEGKFKGLGRGRTEEAYPLVIGTRFNIPFLLDRPGTGHVNFTLFLMHTSLKMFFIL